jgi:hypothetical protein
LSIENLGNAPLNLSVASLCTGTSTEFSVNLAATTVAAGSSIPLTVTYAPTDAGIDSGCIEIASDDPDENPLTVNLSGSAEVLVPDINVAPAAIDFGSTDTTSPVTQTLSIENLGNAPLNLSSASLCAGTSTEFSVNLAATTVATGSSIPLTVTYAPTDAGVDSGCIEITSDDPDENPLTVNVTGSAEMLVADINVTPTALDFGATDIGTPVTQSLTINNLGNAPLNLSGATLCAGTSAEFSVNLAATTVATGSSIPLDVTYTPTDDGVDSGCIEIASNDPDENPLIVAVNGSATAVATGTGVIGDYIWTDSNGNGAQDAGEPGLANVMVTLWQDCDSANPLTTVSDASGAYRFDQLPAGQYQLVFSKPAGYSFSPHIAAGNYRLDSNADEVTGQDRCRPLADGQIRNGLDAGLYPDGSVIETLNLAAAVYFPGKQRIWIKGSSDIVPAGSSDITAIAVTNGVETVLGPLVWRPGKQAYQSTYLNLATAPDSVILRSANGGQVTGPVAVQGGNPGAVDTLKVVNAIHFTTTNKLWIRATSDASPAGSATLTARAVIDGVDTVLGTVAWKPAKGFYQQVFTSITGEVSSVTLQSDKGGRITGPVSVR